MLHLPINTAANASTRHSGGAPARAVAKTSRSAGCRLLIKSRADELIDAFMTARREYRSTRARYDELAARHPALCIDDPIIFLFTNGEGEPVHGDFRDIHRFFPSSQDGWSPGTKKRRETLLAKYGEARQELSRQRKSTGLAASFSQLADASYSRKQRFLAICRHQPRSAQEVRKQSRIVRKFLPEIAHALGDAVTGKRFSIYGEAYDCDEYNGWREARADAFVYLATLARSLSKMGGR